MYVDCKNTIWYRYRVKDKKVLDKLIKAIDNKEIEDENDIRSFLEKHQDIDGEYLWDTTDSLSAEDNQGNPTIEVYKSDILKREL
jgi:hypothetical protein